MFLLGSEGPEGVGWGEPGGAKRRASYAFALVSVAVAARIERGSVRDARIAFGGLAPKPWRARAAEPASATSPLHPTSSSHTPSAHARETQPMNVGYEPQAWTPMYAAVAASAAAFAGLLFGP